MNQVVVVVATRNRPEALERLLEVLQDQTHAPKAVVVVDGSNEELRPAIEALQARRSAIPILWRFSDRPSIPGQRHLGTEVALESYPDASSVLFLDDDVVPAADYIERLMAIFQADVLCSVGGASGVSEQAPVVRAPAHYRLFARFFLLQGGPGGKLLASGINVPVAATAPDVVNADWLFGCSAYRREVFDSYRFDDSREGYVLFEDVDFSARVKKDWVLLVDPQARLRHEQLPNVGAGQEEWSYQFIVNRHTLVMSVLRPRGGATAFWWSTLGYFCYWGVKSLVGDRVGRLRVRGAWRGIRELMRRDR